jgi:hypothetical protein
MAKAGFPASSANEQARVRAARDAIAAYFVDSDIHVN